MQFMKKVIVILSLIMALIINLKIVALFMRSLPSFYILTALLGICMYPVLPNLI